MNAVGIDISKGKSMVAILRPLGVVVANPFEVNHTAAELGKLADYLEKLDGETKVIMEHTGRYYESVAQVIHDRGLTVSAVNPLLIREYGGNSLRRVKTDKADARKIARYGLDNWAELREYTPMDTTRYETSCNRIAPRRMKTVVTQRKYLIDCMGTAPDRLILPLRARL